MAFWIRSPRAPRADLPGSRSGRRAITLGPRQVTWIAVLLGLAVTMPSATAGLLLDDHGHAAFILQHISQAHAGWWDLFDACCHKGTPSVSERIAIGVLPWWTDPHLTMALFRPLAATAHYLDYLLWPNAPVLMHLHNMAWYGAIVALLGAFYRRMMSGGVAALALLMYAVAASHAEGTAWIAGRNTLMCAAFALAALVSYDRLRRDAWRLGAWIAPLALLLGLASGEGAIAVWGYLVPYALWIDRGLARERALSLAPMAAITSGWCVLYSKLGYGMHGSGWYRDPFDAPVFFLMHRVPDVLPSILREELLPGTTAARALPFLFATSWVWITLAICGLTLPVWLLMLVRRRRIAFWSFALFASALPICAIGMTPRLFFLSSAASFALIAELLAQLWTLARAPALRGGLPVRAAALLLAGAWLGVHGPLALAVAPGAYRALIDYEGLFAWSASRLPAFDRAKVDTLFVLNTNNYLVTEASPAYAITQPWPPRLYILGATLTPLRIARPDAFTVRLTPMGGYMLEPVSQFVRAPEVPFSQGQTMVVGPLTARVEEVTSDGRPAAMSFRSEQLAASNQLWVAWYGDRYHAIQLPRVGTEVEIPGW
jgi:hypothetical protein